MGYVNGISRLENTCKRLATGSGPLPGRLIEALLDQFIHIHDGDIPKGELHARWKAINTLVSSKKEPFGEQRVGAIEHTIMETPEDQLPGIAEFIWELWQDFVEYREHHPDEH